MLHVQKNMAQEARCCWKSVRFRHVRREVGLLQQTQDHGHLRLEGQSHQLVSDDGLRGPVARSQLITHDGSLVLLYMVTWIPSIYPKC